MPPPRVLSARELRAIEDPAALLDHAWALEPELRLAERSAALDRLAALLDSGVAVAAPPGRAWRLELLAERAVIAAADVRLVEATQLADRVLVQAAPQQTIAIARAMLARGRALAWAGTDASTRRADAVLAEVAERCAALGHAEWRGFAVFWRGNAICHQNGRPQRAAELMLEALGILGPDSPRRSMVLVFYGEVLATLGRFDEAEPAFAESERIARRDGNSEMLAYVAWSRALLASRRGDATATAERFAEAEAHGGEWLATHIGANLLADAAEALDRVGQRRTASGFLARARALAPEDEFVEQAHATLLARSGEPVEALEALQLLARGTWLEKRFVWRHTLLAAWATFRAGREGAGELCARALRQAQEAGGLAVARSGESELVSALAPLAQRAGSAAARELLLDGRPLLVRLFGTPTLTRADGSPIPFPSARPGELLRMLAANPGGVPRESALQALFPDIGVELAGPRLRQIVLRLRSVLGELVVRDGDRLTLVHVWVDVREFRATAALAEATRDGRAIHRAYAALALHDGPLLPGDRYAAWAEPIRDEVELMQLRLLDRIAADAAARGSHQEALTALEAARDADPFDPHRDPLIAEHLRALGRFAAAEYLAGFGGG